MSRRVLLLVLVAAGLAAWLFLYDLPGEEAQQQRAVDETALIDFDPARVDTLRVVRDNAPWTLAKRVDGAAQRTEWWLVAPIEERADLRTAENALALLLASRSQRRLADEVTEDVWGRYGLSEGHPSRIDLLVVLEGGERVLLNVGSLDPTGEFVFVRPGGTDRLEVVYSELADFALSSHHGFRQRRIFEIDPTQIARLEIEGTRGSWAVQRDADTGLWFAEIEGERRRLQRWEIDDLTHFVAEATVLGYQRDGLSGAQWAGYGLDQPWASLVWTSFDGRQSQLELGNQTADRTYFGRRAGLDTVFEILPGFERYFEQDPRELIDDNPIPRNVRRATVIRIEDVDGTWVRQERSATNEKDWIVTTAAGEVKPTEYVFVSARNVALGLEQLTSDSTMMLAEGRLASGVGRRGPAVRFSWPEGPDLELVLWWIEQQSAPWLQIDGEPTLHRVQRGLFLRLRAMLDAAHAAP